MHNQSLKYSILNHWSVAQVISNYEEKKLEVKNLVGLSLYENSKGGEKFSEPRPFRLVSYA